MDKLELLKRLVQADGLSGDEDAVRGILLESIRDVVDEWHVDVMGNLIAFKKARSAVATAPGALHGSVQEATHDALSAESPRLLLAAHMDEVGLMVTGFEEKGLIRFRAIGGIDPRVLVGQRVRIGAKRVPGVIGYAPIHLQEPSSRKDAPKIKSLRIDIGAKSKEDSEGCMEIGDSVAFDIAPVLFGENKMMAKALDDRAGCAVLAALLHEDWPIDLIAAFNVQEEIGLKGSKTSTWQKNPTHAVILEGTTCYDVPDTKPHMTSTFSGKGPAITVMDRSVINDRAFVRHATKAADEAGIPWQYKNTITGGTDAGRIQANAAGVRVLTMAVPCRYIHTPVSVMDMNDFENLYRLASEVVRRFPEYPVLSREDGMISNEDDAELGIESGDDAGADE